MSQGDEDIWECDECCETLNRFEEYPKEGDHKGGGYCSGKWYRIEPETETEVTDETQRCAAPGCSNPGQLFGENEAPFCSIVCAGIGAMDEGLSASYEKVFGTAPPPECSVHPFSSRSCDRGTRTCTVDHHVLPPGWYLNQFSDTCWHVHTANGGRWAAYGSTREEAIANAWKVFGIEREDYITMQQAVALRDASTSVKLQMQVEQCDALILKLQKSCAMAETRRDWAETDRNETQAVACRQVAAQATEILGLEAELASLKGRWDASAAAGSEAEDLRRGIENLLSQVVVDVEGNDLQRLLDSVDARDSLAYLQKRDDEFNTMSRALSAYENAGHSPDKQSSEAASPDSYTLVVRNWANLEDGPQIIFTKGKGCGGLLIGKDGGMTGTGVLSSGGSVQPDQPLLVNLGGDRGFCLNRNGSLTITDTESPTETLRLIKVNANTAELVDIDQGKWGESVHIGDRIVITRPLDAVTRAQVEPLSLVTLALHDRLVALEDKLREPAPPHVEQGDPASDVFETCHECRQLFDVVHPLNVRCALCQCKLDHGAIEAVLKATGHLSLSALVSMYPTPDHQDEDA